MITLATKVTIFRIFLVAPITLLLAHNYLVAAGFGLALAAFTDWLDGYIARRYHQQTALGALLDPLADKLLMVSIFTGIPTATLSPDGLLFFYGLKRACLHAARSYFFYIRISPWQRVFLAKLLWRVNLYMVCFFFLHGIMK